jgi:peptide/nickel transport system permease protein
MISMRWPKNNWLVALITRRALHGVAVLFGVFTLSFALAEFAPGDYFDSLRLDPTVPDEAVEALRQRYGQHRSGQERYLVWLGGAVRGDLGHSFSHRRPVTEILLPRVRNTLVLSAPAMCIAWITAVIIGSVFATFDRRWIRSVFGALTSALVAIPDLFLALGFMILALKTGWFPTGGMVSFRFADLGPWERLEDMVRHLVLPLAALVLSLLPVLLRHVHDSMREVLQSPLIRAVRALGVKRGRLLFRHALPVAANPLVTLFGLSIGTLLSVSLLIEVVVGWPGLGPLLLEAILARDVDLVLGSILLSTLLMILGNFSADVLLITVDPSLRKER